MLRPKFNKSNKIDQRYYDRVTVYLAIESIDLAPSILTQRLGMPPDENGLSEGRVAEQENAGRVIGGSSKRQYILRSTADCQHLASYRSHWKHSGREQHRSRNQIMRWVLGWKDTLCLQYLPGRFRVSFGPSVLAVFWPISWERMRHR